MWGYRLPVGSSRTIQWSQNQLQWTRKGSRWILWSNQPRLLRNNQHLICQMQCNWNSSTSSQPFGNRADLMACLPIEGLWRRLIPYFHQKSWNLSKRMWHLLKYILQLVKKNLTCCKVDKDLGLLHFMVTSRTLNHKGRTLKRFRLAIRIAAAKQICWILSIETQAEGLILHFHFRNVHNVQSKNIPS